VDAHRKEERRRVVNFHWWPGGTLTWYQLDEDIVPVFREPKKARRDASPAREVHFGTDFEFVDLGETGQYAALDLFHT